MGTVILFTLTCLSGLVLVIALIRAITTAITTSSTLAIEEKRINDAIVCLVCFIVTAIVTLIAIDNVQKKAVVSFIETNYGEDCNVVIGNNHFFDKNHNLYTFDILEQDFLSGTIKDIIITNTVTNESERYDDLCE